MRIRAVVEYDVEPLDYATDAKDLKAFALNYERRFLIEHITEVWTNKNITIEIGEVK